MEDNLYFFLMFDWKTVISIFSIFSLFLKFPISSPISQITKELCSSPSYTFHLHFRHLTFNGMMKKEISSQNMTNSNDFFFYVECYSEVYYLIRLRTCSLVTLSSHFIFSSLHLLPVFNDYDAPNITSIFTSLVIFMYLFKIRSHIAEHT